MFLPCACIGRKQVMALKKDWSILVLRLASPHLLSTRTLSTGNVALKAPHRKGDRVLGLHRQLKEGLSYKDIVSIVCASIAVGAYIYSM